jgi:hypothetical protein
MAIIAVSVLALGLAAAVVWIKVGSRRVRKQTHKAARSEDTEGFPTSKGGQKIMRHSGLVLEAAVLAHCRIRVSHYTGEIRKRVKVALWRART